MIEFEFRVDKSENMHTHLDIELFYVMEGRVDFIVEDQTFLLESEDFLMVNSGRRHAYEGSQETLAACFHISYDELSKLLKQNLILFWCNSTAEEGELYEEVRELIKKIISQHYYHAGEDMIYLYSLYYELLHMLQNNFLLTEEDSRYKGELHKFDDRKQKIAEYIRQNYDKPIALSDLAKDLYLSTAYLSKYIKKQFGMSFLEYVNSVRLGYAISELLHSDKPVVRIAMDTGFANSASFNKAFKEKYHTTPSVYRSQWKNDQESAIKAPRIQNIQKKQVDAYFERHKNYPAGQVYVQDITLENTEGEPYRHHWQMMINGGTAADLLRSDLQEHLCLLHRRLKIRYVRFWDLYSREMLLDHCLPSGLYNFSRLDLILDFLLEHGMKPYIELGMKPKKLLKSRQSVLIGGGDSDGIFADENRVREFMSALMHHLVERYGGSEIENWYFELWQKELESNFFHKEVPDSEALIRKYFSTFDLVAGVLREILPGVRLGSGGFSLRHGKERFREMIHIWHEFLQKPDFMTFYSYSYPAEMETADKIRSQSMDKDFLKNFLKDIRELMDAEGYIGLPVHVTEWNFTVSNRNVFNDSCQKGAYVMKNIIDTIGMADVLGYWCASDIFAEYYDTGDFLFGGSGLLTKDGICKPAYYAMEFMDRIGQRIYQRGENYLITGDDKDEWYVVCHNYKHFNFQYGLRQEDEIHVAEQSQLIVDGRKLRLKFSFPLPFGAGKYSGQEDVPVEIKIYAVNSRTASIQDRWLRAGFPRFLHPEDMAYFKSASVPAIRVRSHRVLEDRITFETILEPNEIQWIRVKVGQYYQGSQTGQKTT